MASLPPRQASQRRTSPREQGNSAERSNLTRADSETLSTASADSDTVLFDSAHILSGSSFSQKTEAKQAPPQPQYAEEDEPRKCWICFNDETEDAPDSSAWRSPCPCALVAHEDCLLDWVASQEAPNPRRQAGTGSKFKCPQCKNEIHLKRPTSKVVDGVRAIERITNLLILPGTMGVLGYTVYQACFMHGVSTVYALFGLEDGYRILQPLHQAPTVLRTGAHSSVALAAVTRFFQHARLHFGLSAIPPILVASRVSIADSILPILPVVFLASSNAGDDMLNFGHWPPSAALSFSLLPYIRGAYNTYMERAWAEKQRQWLKDIQPRAGETDGGEHEDEDADVDRIHDDDDGPIFELNLDLVDEEDDEHFHDDFHALPGAGQWPANRPDDDDDQQRAPPLDANGMPQARPQQQQQGGAAPPQQQPRPRQNNRRERNLIFQTSNIADTVLGALVFPSIAAAMGELIRLGLPKAWVTPPASGRSPTAFLQQRWARSLVGGCLFVAVKDAVMLYVRWKMAQNHRKRKVLDYDKKKGKVVER
ncbi:ring finger domain protein [Diplodia corticola]|uniref:Ring finger domain protein n=1 Tax=Diplodia corticola TaxID=236234 RepID=A0A1J9RKY9_9PEZI|nr:ring finger domain protein [Diplodia corticola]OJD40634.1 ring finger domain protein [Diplodia corticola]